MTPILCFLGYYTPFQQTKKSYILCKLGYTLNSGAPPPHIYRPKPVFTIVLTKLCKLGYTLILETHPIYIVRNRCSL